MALIPGYRGFTIDSLPKLCALDDVNITPDERHEFLGLAGNPGEVEGFDCSVISSSNAHTPTVRGDFICWTDVSLQSQSVLILQCFLCFGGVI